MRGGGRAGRVLAVTSPFEELSVEELRAHGSIKWRQYDADVLPLWIAEMDAMPPQPVVAELVAMATSGDRAIGNIGWLYAHDAAEV